MGQLGLELFCGLEWRAASLCHDNLLSQQVGVTHGLNGLSRHFISCLNWFDCNPFLPKRLLMLRFPSALTLLLWHHQPSAGDLLLMEIASGMYTPFGNNLTAYQPESQYVKSGDVKILLLWSPSPCKESLTWRGALWQIPLLFTSVLLHTADCELCGTFLLCCSSLGIIFLLAILFMGVISLGNALQAALISRSGSFLSYFHCDGVDRK